MIVVGIIGAGYSSFLYYNIIPIIEENQRENIFLHLEGNSMLFDNFYEVTSVRAILKLDFLFNLEFISCLVFILLLEQVFSPPHDNHGTIPIYVPWITVVALFTFVTWANRIGTTTTVSKSLK